MGEVLQERVAIGPVSNVLRGNGLGWLEQVLGKGRKDWVDGGCSGGGPEEMDGRCWGKCGWVWLVQKRCCRPSKLKTTC